jgi:hypothetical protein
MREMCRAEINTSSWDLLFLFILALVWILASEAGETINIIGLEAVTDQ